MGKRCAMGCARAPDASEPMRSENRMSAGMTSAGAQHARQQQPPSGFSSSFSSAAAASSSRPTLAYAGLWVHMHRVGKGKCSQRPRSSACCCDRLHTQMSRSPLPSEAPLAKLL